MGGMVEVGASASVRLPESLVEGLRAEARRERKSVATLINEFLADRQDYRDAIASQKRSAGKKSHSLADIKRRYGL